VKPRRAGASAAAAGGVALALATVFGAAPAWAQAPASEAGEIYTCIDAQGRRLTSDRPIAECSAREQRVLNRDGSVRRILPPTLTAEERAEREARERREAELRAAQQEAARRDRQLASRFRDEAAHRRAREAALEPMLLAIRASEQRQLELAAERKPLLDEAEFYAGRERPQKLKAQLDANDAAVAAQRSAVQTQRAEVDRINRLYDVELDRLRRLWAGAAPGSLGPLPAVVTPTAATTPQAPRR
jgi:hypothetical protein